MVAKKPTDRFKAGYLDNLLSESTRVRSHSLLVFPTCLKVGRETTLRSNIVNSQRTQIEIELSLAVQPGTKAGLNKHSVGQKSITWVRNKNLQQSQFELKTDVSNFFRRKDQVSFDL